MKTLTAILMVALALGFGVFMIATSPIGKPDAAHAKSSAGLQGFGTGVYTCDEEGYRMATMRMLPGSPWFLKPGEAADAARSFAAQTKDQCAADRFLDWAAYFDGEEKKVQAASHAGAIEKKLRQELNPHGECKRDSVLCAELCDDGTYQSTGYACYGSSPQVEITTIPPTVDGFEVKP